MITAAVTSSFRVLRMRCSVRRPGSSPSPRTSGITATPVSNPESPRARRGNRITDRPIMASGLARPAKSASRQEWNTSGWRATA